MKEAVFIAKCQAACKANPGPGFKSLRPEVCMACGDVMPKGTLIHYGIRQGCKHVHCIGDAELAFEKLLAR
jgi:hypothetical protein